MVRVFLSLGSNLGDRERYLSVAIKSLGARGIEIIRVAGIYETEHKDVTHQPWFLNTVVEAKTSLTPRQLLAAVLAIEQENQRVRTQPKSARTLDVDIIFYGQEVIAMPGLSIPHPRFAERRFVLYPLNEIAPDFI